MYRVEPIINVKGGKELETGLLSAGVDIQRTCLRFGEFVVTLLSSSIS